MLIVWHPTKEFLDFLEKNRIPYKTYQNKLNGSIYYGEIDHIKVRKYKLGMFKGVIGNSAEFNGELI